MELNLYLSYNIGKQDLSKLISTFEFSKMNTQEIQAFIHNGLHRHRKLTFNGVLVITSENLNYSI